MKERKLTTTKPFTTSMFRSDRDGKVRNPNRLEVWNGAA